MHVCNYLTTRTVLQCHALLLMQHPDLLSTVPHVTPGLQLGLLTHKLQLCVTSSDYPQWSPSIIGVSLLSLELEQFRPDWFPLTLFLLKAVKVCLPRIFLRLQLCLMMVYSPLPWLTLALCSREVKYTLHSCSHCLIDSCVLSTRR